jgi:hypothetical protein
MTKWRMYITCTCWVPYKHTEYVILFFSTATIVAGTRLNVTLYVHCLSLLVTVIIVVETYSVLLLLLL